MRIYEGELSLNISLEGELTTNNVYEGELGTFYSVADVPAYTGEYIVIPKADTQQILETQNKLMLDDVTVTEVPYFETSNVAGGLTVYIANEV